LGWLQYADKLADWSQGCWQGIYHTLWHSGSLKGKTHFPKNQVHFIVLLTKLTFWYQNLLLDGQAYKTRTASISYLRQQIQECIEAIPNYFLQRGYQAISKKAEVVMVVTLVTQGTAF
jgi:hypothetical protein